MRERPILFTAPMVRAILEGRKTQTRRVVKPQWPTDVDDVSERPALDPILKCVVSGHSGEWEDEHALDEIRRCPYGVPGDQLWVREEHHITLRDPRSVRVRYSDGTVCEEVVIGSHEHALFLGRKRPLAVTRARFMWRCLSRIQLEITGVRVERLQDISEEDAKAEGIDRDEMIGNRAGQPIYRDYSRKITDEKSYWFANPIDSYRTLWESINGPGSWAANPWAWVVEFRRITK